VGASAQPCFLARIYRRRQQGFLLKMSGEQSKSQVLFDFGALAHCYDQWYETPEGAAHDQTQRSDVKYLLPARKGGALLDLGCGTGHWTRFFARLGYRVFGADLSMDMLAIAQTARATKGRLAAADARALPFGPGAFNVVAAMAVLEFVAEPESALHEMVRPLKRGGALLIGTLNRGAPLNRRRTAEGRAPYASARMFAPRELRSLLARFGAVKMVASGPAEAGSAVPKPRPHSSQTENLHGPFIVALVQT
jgi:ubiquinone/menaquinone biosynthesis C-methylase UbiE